MHHALVFKPGSVVWIPCELKEGFAPTESSVKIVVPSGEKEIVGFVPKYDIQEEAPNKGVVRAVVLQGNDSTVSVVFRGEMLSHSNPVTVPTDWLNEVGRAA